MFMERMRVVIHSVAYSGLLLCSIYFCFLLWNKRKNTQFLKITFKVKGICLQKKVTRLTLVVIFMASMLRPWVQWNDKLLANLVSVRELNVCFSKHHKHCSGTLRCWKCGVINLYLWFSRNKTCLFFFFLLIIISTRFGSLRLFFVFPERSFLH